jgi:hypothetical protein
MKANKTTTGWECQTTGEEKTSKQNSIDLAAQNQIQKQLNGWNHHIPININTECQWT